jgi:hypothetical protein
MSQGTDCRKIDSRHQSNTKYIVTSGATIELRFKKPLNRKIGTMLAYIVKQIDRVHPGLARKLQTGCPFLRRVSTAIENF